MFVVVVALLGCCFVLFVFSVCALVLFCFVFQAEGVQSYFGVNVYADPPDGIHNNINTREALRGYDPKLYAFIEEFFPCDNTYIDRCENDRGEGENSINSSLPGKKKTPFHDIFICIFLNKSFCNSIKISLKFVHKGLINNNPALVRIMACHWIGDEPLSEAMLTRYMPH